MIAAIERYFARRRERRYRLHMADIATFDIGAFCTHCRARVDTPKDRLRLRKWFTTLRDAAPGPRAKLRWPENKHQCEDLK